MRRECSNAFNEAAHVQIHKLNRKSHNLSNIHFELMTTTTMNECDCAQNPGRTYCNDGRKTMHVHKPMLWHFINWLVCIVDVQCSGSAVVFLNAIRFIRAPAVQCLHFRMTNRCYFDRFFCMNTAKRVWKKSIESIPSNRIDAIDLAKSTMCDCRKRNTTIIDGHFPSSWDFSASFSSGQQVNLLITFPHSSFRFSFFVSFCIPIWFRIHFVANMVGFDFWCRIPFLLELCSQWKSLSNLPRLSSSSFRFDSKWSTMRSIRSTIVVYNDFFNAIGTIWPHFLLQSIILKWIHRTKWMGKYGRRNWI